MSTAIWKYEISPIGRTTITTPMGFTSLTVGVQGAASVVSRKVVLWAEVNPNAQRTMQRVFEVLMTGASNVPSTARYIGTFQFDDGAYVGHVYEVFR